GCLLLWLPSKHLRSGLVGLLHHGLQARGHSHLLWKFTPQLAELNAVDNSEKITKTRKIAQLYKEKPRFTSPRLSGTSNLLCRVDSLDKEEINQHPGVIVYELGLLLWIICKTTNRTWNTFSINFSRMRKEII
ncbi:GSCOCG00005949001-RA-CDS, partial [Cotesia congregata]